MKRIATRIDEFVQMAEPKTTPAPVTTPAPTTTPSPSKPGPIRRERPAVDPKPQASAEDVVNRFMKELKKVSKPFNINLEKLKQKYGN